MKWTPKKTRIVWLFTGFLLVIALAVEIQIGDIPTGGHATIAVRVLIVVGVLLVLQYVREIR